MHISLTSGWKAKKVIHIRGYEGHLCRQTQRALAFALYVVSKTTSIESNLSANAVQKGFNWGAIELSYVVVIFCCVLRKRRFAGHRKHACAWRSYMR